MKRYVVYLIVALLMFIISVGLVIFINDIVSFLWNEYSALSQEEYHCTQ
jgi:hypothetical protein